MNPAVLNPTLAPTPSPVSMSGWVSGGCVDRGGARDEVAGIIIVVRVHAHPRNAQKVEVVGVVDVIRVHAHPLDTCRKLKWGPWSGLNGDRRRDIKVVGTRVRPRLLR